MAPTLFNVLLAATICLSSTFSPVSAELHKRYVVKDEHAAPRGWNYVEKAPGHHVINLSIGLKQGNFEELERHLYEVSDPLHQRYGQHLSAEEVNSLVKPSAETHNAVHEWLAEHGITSDHLEYSPAQDFVKITLPVHKVEQLLDTKYSVWEHDDGATLIRTEAFSLPLHLHDHISTVQPTNSWARLNSHRHIREVRRQDSPILHPRDALQDVATLASNPAIAAACNFSSVTPTCIRTLYGILDYTPQAGGKSGMGSTNYLGEYNNRSDTYLYLQKFRPEAAQAALNFQQISVNGGSIDNNTKHLDIEQYTGFAANTESQVMLGVAWPLNLTTWSTGGRNPTYKPSIQSEFVSFTPGENSAEPFLDWANYVVGQPDSVIPQVISTSYYDDEQTVSQDYAMTVCKQFAQLGARGVTLLVTSGGFGVGLNQTCYSNKDNTTKAFTPQFPATCPYVTSVGSTFNYPEEGAYATTTDGYRLASGAGFSNYYDMPAYQKTTVNAYVKSLNGLHNGLYNSTGRAFPDISCVGQTLSIFWNGTQDAILGPGQSTPVCASVLALVNDALLAKGRKPLGFLNPWLYQEGYKAFTDVVKGDSAGCQTTGFPATTGWDAVTGFGTPYFPKILKLLGVEPAKSSTTTSATGTSKGTVAPTATTSGGFGNGWQST